MPLVLSQPFANSTFPFLHVTLLQLTNRLANGMQCDGCEEVNDKTLLSYYSPFPAAPPPSLLTGLTDKLASGMRGSSSFSGGVRKALVRPCCLVVEAVRSRSRATFTPTSSVGDSSRLSSASRIPSASAPKQATRGTSSFCGGRRGCLVSQENLFYLFWRAPYMPACIYQVVVCRVWATIVWSCLHIYVLTLFSLWQLFILLDL